jgi:hypothetical protein
MSFSKVVKIRHYYLSISLLGQRIELFTSLTELRGMSKKRNHGQFTRMLLLDVEKAFDSVWHNALFHKLFSKSILFILFSMNVLFKSVLASPNRLPQEAVLFSNLYNFFTSDENLQHLLMIMLLICPV